MLHPPFTRENAAAYARKAVAKRLANQAALKAAAKGQAPLTPKPEKEEPFTARQVARVRKQIEMLNDAIDRAIKAEKIDAQGIDRLSAAVTRLRESERILRNQPLPGSYKPVVQRTKRSYQSSVMPESIETRNSVEGSGQ